VAAWAAMTRRASRLILLKSIEIPPGIAWAEAAERGWVDRHFPICMNECRLPVEAIHFRAWLDEKH
jgi:hypothetical protein